MSDKPTGVFIRLPLSDEDVRAMDKAISHGWVTQARPTQESCAEDGILAIGTPVTAGDLKPIGKVAGHFSDGQPMVRILNHPHLPYETEIALYSDAQAQIAALEAEVGRLRERYGAIRWRFIQDARIEGRTLTERQFDALVDNDDEAHKALKGGAA